MDICSCLLHLIQTMWSPYPKWCPRETFKALDPGLKPLLPKETLEALNLLRVWFSFAVVTGPTSQVYRGPMDLNPKLRTLGKFHHFFSSLSSHKVILGAPLVSESSNPSMAALRTFCTARCHQKSTVSLWVGIVASPQKKKNVPLRHYLEEFSTMPKLKLWV